MNRIASKRLDGVFSGLFVPAGNARLLNSASSKKMALVVVDLEDAIPPDCGPSKSTMENDDT
jgi:hypothetical protein